MIMIIFKAIFVAGSFLLFVISSGLWFEQFRKYSLAVVLAGLFTLYAALETLGFPAGHWLTSTWQEAYVLVQGISSRKGEAPMAVEVPKPTSTPLQAQSVLSDCPLCPELGLIKPGTFTMGTSEQEPGYQAREAPPHTVRIAEPF